MQRMKSLKILGVFILDRIKEAQSTQKVLSQYNHLIKARLGFHELHEGSCSRQAFIILHLQGNPNEWETFEQELQAIGGVQVQHMSFQY
jgi:metal-responsive CopG/Arc/MetJ family transcriptional regulator